MEKRAALKAQVGALWRQAVDQLDDVRQVVRRRGDRIEADLRRVMAERDRLFVLLGEQTYKLANQGRVPLPAFVQRTVERLNEVITSLTPAPTTRRGSGHAHSEMHASESPKKRTAKKGARKTRGSASKTTN